jgi:plastocyanin
VTPKYLLKIIRLSKGFGLACGLALVLQGAAHAEDHLITQKDKSFTQNGITINDIKVHAGDTLTFTNGDVVTHNVFSKSPGNEFEIPKQEPGVTASATMKTPGEVDIRCAIHPKMKLHVTVEPASAASPAKNGQ